MSIQRQTDFESRWNKSASLANPSPSPSLLVEQDTFQSRWDRARYHPSAVSSSKAQAPVEKGLVERLRRKFIPGAQVDVLAVDESREDNSLHLGGRPHVESDEELSRKLSHLPANETEAKLLGLTSGPLQSGREVGSEKHALEIYDVEGLQYGPGLAEEAHKKGLGQGLLGRLRKHHHH
jgi:hypothetical protein